MITVVDTSAWVEWLVGTRIGRQVSRHLPEQVDWVVPTLVQLELAKWLTRELDEDHADQIMAFTQICQIVPLDTDIALAAAEACKAHRLATADAIVFATAQSLGASLLTCDAHFEGLPGVILIKKVQSARKPAR